VSAGAAVVHASVIASHFREYWLFGLFFLVIAPSTAGPCAQTAPFPLLAALRGRASGAVTARRATALRQWFTGRPERRLLGHLAR
jgi:hypothetical protein